LPIGNMLLLMIFMSPGTHLTNFSDDKIVCSIYMTISNPCAAARIRAQCTAYC
ncbi:hypothetical protein K440DRAFT_561747, partial [Wilcoxina mikolae CBS 423.85]